MQKRFDFRRVIGNDEFQARRAEKFQAFELWLEKQPKQYLLFSELKRGQKNNIIAFVQKRAA